MSELQRLIQQARESSETTQAELERLQSLLDQIERATRP
jgi:predicted transcriptional regulator